MKYIDGPKDIAMIAFAVLVIVATIISLIASAPPPETKNVKLAFDVGGINDDGDVDLTNTQSLYTKKLIECTGLHIVRYFDADVTFTVFFYDTDDKLVSSVVVSGRQYNVERGDMPVSQDGRAAVGFRVSVVNNNSKEAFSMYEAYQMKAKFDVDITTLPAE